MKTLKFISKNENEHRFGVAVRKNVHQYFKINGISVKGNSVLFTQAIIMLSVYLVPFTVILFIPLNIWPALFMTILMGIGMAGIGMCVMHDAVHGSFSNKEWMNKIMGGTMYLLGSNVFNWKVQHNILHHTYTNIEGFDQDIESKGPIRLSQFAPVRKIHRYQYIHAFFFYGLMTISKLVRDFTQLILFRKAGLTTGYRVSFAKEYIKMLITKSMYLIIFLGLPLTVCSYSWWQILTGFFIMHWVAGCILSTVFQMAHVVEGASQTMPVKDGIIHRDWNVHQLATTSDFARDNHFLNWYVGGLNFQIEHHLFPNISHVHYQKIAPIVEKTAVEFGFKYNLKPTFMKALSSHIKRLKELGKP